MRRLLGLAVLLCLGCSGGSTGDPDASTCEPGYGELVVCIYGGPTSTTPSGGTATARRSETDVPFIMPTTDGCSMEQIEVGFWQVSGNDPSGTCPTPFEPVEVRECETTTVRVETDMWCVDG